MLFTLKKVIGNMLLPLPLMLLIIGAGLALLWFSRFQKTGKIFISIGWLALLLLSLQPVGRPPAASHRKHLSDME